MHMIAYTSHYKGNEQDIQKQLERIVRSAKHNNAKLGVTGVLLFDHDRFVQVIEGDKSALDKLFNVIKQDPRHHDIKVLFDTPIKAREFAEWNMDAFAIGGHNEFDEELIENFQQVYEQNFKLSSAQLVNWTKRLISEPKRFLNVITD